MNNIVLYTLQKKLSNRNEFLFDNFFELGDLIFKNWLNFSLLWDARKEK